MKPCKDSIYKLQLNPQGDLVQNVVLANDMNRHNAHASLLSIAVVRPNCLLDDPRSDSPSTAHPL